ncbi:unnamed protein product [Ceratitis capitata]|uniref:(Mediterranean fruit fly) hypothetical protein n=1 Tax=Ceratitis capitata TaxID=7213 RepID=A0A811U7H3_CERCA|nr:unnamed protein product [Ceratitis capitata]
MHARVYKPGFHTQGYAQIHFIKFTQFPSGMQRVVALQAPTAQLSTGGPVEPYDGARCEVRARLNSAQLHSLTYNFHHFHPKRQITSGTPFRRSGLVGELLPVCVLACLGNKH